MKLHQYITSGEDIELLARTVIEKKNSFFGFYLPRMIEFISSKTFAQAEDLSFICSIAVLGAKLSKPMYERIENAFRAKMKTSDTLAISKYVIN